MILSPVVVMIIMLLETINVSCVNFDSDRLVGAMYAVPGRQGLFWHCPSLSRVDGPCIGSGKLDGQSNKSNLWHRNR